MIDEAKHLGPKYYYDEDCADAVVNWFPTHLRHTVGPYEGEPFVLSDWQENDIIRPLFGIKRKENGRRRYRTVWIEIPKKNGKTTLIAGVCLMSMAALHEPAARVFCLACDKDQATLCFEEASNMVESSPTLSNRLVIYKDKIVKPSVLNKKTGEFRAKCEYKPLSSSVGKNDGKNPFVVAIDEVHRQKNWELYRVMQHSMAARPEPILFMMTTAGVWDPEGLYFNLNQRYMKVYRGEVENDSALVCWYGADKDDDWEDEKTWYKANPELGKAKDLEGMREAYKVTQLDPREINNFKRLHLNIITSQTTAAIDMADWAKCGGPIDYSSLIGRRCYGGLDLSRTTDLTAMLLLFPPEDEDDSWKMKADFWLPRERMMKLQDQDGVPYDEWVHDGWVTATEGDVIDYRYIRKRINECDDLYDIHECGFDPYAAQQLSIELEDDGINMIEVKQWNTTMNAATQEFLKLVIEGKMAHGDNPVLTWMASNLQIRTNYEGYIKPDKGASTQKIDGIVAAIIAMARGILSEASFGPSVYSEKGGLFL